MDVISVHVPKTAGSSFQRILTTVYGDARVMRDNDEVPMNPLMPYNVDWQAWRESSSAQVRSIAPEFRAIHGHFAIEKYIDAFPDARRIAWVRHPTSWVISLYFYWKHVAIRKNPLVIRLQDEQMSLEEFAHDPSVRNRVSGCFLKGVPLSDFDFIGVQEHFNDDVRDLVRLMEWRELPLRIENSNPAPGYTDQADKLRKDARLFDRLVSLNEEDMNLYEEALTLRTKRIVRGR